MKKNRSEYTGGQEYDDYEEYDEIKGSDGFPRGLRERFNSAADRLHKKDGSSRLSSGLNFILYLLCIVIGALAIRQFIFEPTVVKGESMQTTLMNGERLFVEKVSYWFHEPQRGDIVIVHFPNRKECFVKRVVALEGETIEIRGGFVYINGEKLDESEYAGDWYGEIWRLIETKGSVNGKYTVPRGHVFVMGDNRNNSHDSRFGDVGAIPLSQVLGKAHFVIWPIKNIRNPYK